MGRILKTAYTYDDVLLVPNKSEVLPKQVDLTTQLTKTIKLNIPLISASMDTVTEAPMAIAMANEGGLGIIHKNMSIDKQADQIKKVKQTAPTGEKAALDDKGRLLVGGAVGVTQNMMDRIAALVDSQVDIITIDSAHGDSQGVLNAVSEAKKAYPELPVIAGNVATGSATEDLIKAGADVVKVGIGPGAICTTRIVAGVGVPQLTAVMDSYEMAKKYDVAIIADGGLKFSGDIVKAIAAGGRAVMMGSMLAGTKEAPGEIMVDDLGRKFKSYRGMGSLAAMHAGSNDRYFQENAKKLVPEGVEGKVEYKGTVADTVFEMLGGLRAGMGYLGAKNLQALTDTATFVVQTGAGLKESHPHEIVITEQAPNYSKKNG